MPPRKLHSFVENFRPVHNHLGQPQRLPVVFHLFVQFARLRRCQQFSSGEHLKQALIRVQRGATLRVTRRRKVVAQIGPAQPDVAAKPWPDLGARAQRVLGKRVLKSGAGDVILSGRGDW